MKASCMQEHLARGLAIVNRAVATRTPMPILANILIETSDSRLKLSATNLEIGISCWIAASVEAEGAITVPARLLADFVNTLPAREVGLSLDARTQTLNLSADRFNADFKGIDPTDFPLLPTVEHGVHFGLEAAGLREMINQVTIAAATDESRPILTGVLTHLDPDAGRISMVAADGFRLSVRWSELDASLAGPLSVIVPARALLELSRIATDEDGTIQVSITENRNQIMFRMRSVDLVSQLIDGTFPDYERILPTEHTTRIVVSTKAMQNAVRLASFFARDGSNIVRVEVQPGDELKPGTVVVSAQAAEVGENQTEVEAAIIGPGLQVAFNAKYLLDIVGVVGSDQFALELTSPGRPGVFRPVSETDFVHVVMPMNLGQ